MKKLPCPVSLGKKCRVLTFVPMEMDEVDESVDLVRETFPHMEIPYKFWKRKLEQDETILLKRGKNIIGITNVSCNAPSLASLDLLAVRPGKQGRGFGTGLLDVAESIAKDCGKTSITLSTEQIKPENVAFYSKNGYKVIGFNPAGYVHSPSVEFKKKL